MPQEDYKFSIQSDGVTYEITSGKEHKGELAVIVSVPGRSTTTNLTALIKVIKALNYFKSQHTEETKANPPEISS